MSRFPNDQHTSLEMHDEENESEYEAMELLERLSSLREDMEDLKLKTPSAKAAGVLSVASTLPTCLA
jgi:hypothetical protein